jgi:endonuclease/exonuclease/phosphatase family metal-dependent hydrolase
MLGSDPLFMKFASILFFALTTLSPAVGVRVATFNIGANLVIPPNGGSVYFDYGLGDPGTPDHDNVLAVLDRIDADVVTLQEIHSADVAGSNDDVDALAASLGYPYIFVSPTTNTFDTSLRVIFLSRYPFITTAAIGSPVGAKEITRLFPAVKVDVPGTTRDPLLIAAHLKSGTTSEDRFRRAVEMRRLTDNLGAQALTSDDNYIVLGDFNLSSTNKTFTALPAGLPSTFDLGADILFPINYSTNPLSYFSSPSVTRLDPRQLNNSASTFQSGSVIDLFLVSPAIAGRPLGMEIYNSTLDTSNIAGLAKSGSPLAAGTSAAASDHYALFADFELDADFPNLSVALSASSVVEGSADGVVNLTATLPATRVTALTVTITSDDPTAANAISPMLVIPAGSLSASVGIRTPRNFIEDDERSVSLVASASGYDPASGVLQVSDVDEPYVFIAPGQTISEAFTGFSGAYAPAPWVTSGGVWQAPDTGTSGAVGFRSYGTPTDSALGFLPAATGGIATATFTNQSTTVLSAMHISFTAEQWRAAFGGTADRLTVELVTAGGATPLPALTFNAATQLPSGAIANGVTSAREMIVSGLAMAPGASFDLRFTFTPGAGGGVAPADVFINEFHYDNASTDTGEFIEVVVGPGFTGSLSDIDVLLYNGAGGATYGTSHALSTFTAGAVTPSMHRFYSKLISGIQNGDPDGIALVVGGIVKQFISYGGSFQASGGAASGMTSFDIGVKQTTTEVVGQAALGLTGSGAVSADFSWTKFSNVSHSPGQVNSGQTFSVPLQTQGIAIDNLSVTFLADTDGDGLPDITDLDDDNDSFSDADEFVFGTNPLDANSRHSMSLVFPSPAPGMVRLTFPTALGRTYTVESSLNLSSWSAVGSYAGTGNQRAVDVAVNPVDQQKFYRIRATVP